MFVIAIFFSVFFFFCCVNDEIKDKREEEEFHNLSGREKEAAKKFAKMF